MSTESDSTSAFDPTTPAQQEILEKRRHQEKSDPELRDTQKELVTTQRKSLQASIDLNLVSDADAVAAVSLNTKEQNPPVTSQRKEHVMKSSGSGPMYVPNTDNRLGKRIALTTASVSSFGKIVLNVLLY